MNLKTIALATILGLSAPAIADVALNTHTIAQPSAPLGTFTDSQWLVTIEYYDNALSYYGENLITGDNLTLRGATIGGNRQRRIYTWNNSGYRYQVSWRPSQPEVIRVQVFDTRGKEILNHLLTKSN
ncbi:MAG TPA: hypothetical protein DDZ80_22390 [Cyanobacteria bacterium UBA8803]|nr:hypothetical protein [Cyanobacteria bacterium UBA9273]HBL61077.1 hypothetical protein [Cyanobacteria bacterium UBA8803]